MSLSSIMNSATTGLIAAQTGLRVTSDNIANVNTPGYVRKQAIQEALVPAGMSAGVNVAGVRRAADTFLQKAAMVAGADAARAGAVAEMMDRAQGLFGDPSEGDAFFSRLDEVFSAFSAAADDPASSLRRSQAIDSLNVFFSDANRIAGSLSSLVDEADKKIADDIDKVNDLLARIDDLNSDIARAQSSGVDASGSENVQTELVNELGKLININVNDQPSGGVVIRTNDGLAISGQGAAKLSYSRQPGSPGDITITLPGGANPQPIRLQPTSGEIRGLLDLRDITLPGISQQLGEYVTRAADELNRAHNAGSAVPPPSTLTGRRTGMDMGMAATGFTGKTTVSLVNAAGITQRRIDIDFDAMTMTIDGGGAIGFTSATFDGDLDTALGGMGTASFSDGRLVLTASGGNGIAIADDPTTPATKAGKGFSHFFGLNDLVSSGGMPYYETGVTASSPNGFTGGDQLVLRVSDGTGKRLRDVTVSMPTGGTMQDVLDVLNASAGGVGLYGQFALDGDGNMSFTPATGTGATVSVVSDSTHLGGGAGPALSMLFGIGATARSARSNSFFVRPDIAGDSSKLAFATLDLNATGGQPALAVGDPRNARRLAAVGEAQTGFDAAGVFGATTGSVTRYGAELSGSIGRASEAAEQRKSSAEAVSDEATSRRSSAEGVNLDEELVNMTTYQQAFNASSRLIQAAKDMYDALLSVVG